MNDGIKVVFCGLNGEPIFWGKLEYCQGEWAGIRQDDGRLDEAPKSMCKIINGMKTSQL